MCFRNHGFSYYSPSLLFCSEFLIHQQPVSLMLATIKYKKELLGWNKLQPRSQLKFEQTTSETTIPLQLITLHNLTVG